MSPWTSPRSDSTAMGLALFSATVMIAHQVAGKAVRDALFLSHFDVTELPKVVIVAAILSVAAVLLMSRLLARFGPIPLIPAIFGISALLFAGEWTFLDRYPAPVVILLYLHMGIFGAILISGFWSVISERFDPHTAKHHIARIAAAATFGGVAGGLVAERVTALLDVRTMLLVLSGMHLLCVAAVLGVGNARREVAQEPDAKVRSGLKLIGRRPYLRQMGALMASVAVMAALLDYALKAEASAAFAGEEALVTFFAGFYAVTGVIGFGLQTALGPKVLQRFGIAPVVATLPAAVAAAGLLAGAVAQLWAVVLVRGAHVVLAHSFFRSGFELLYTPLPPKRKRPTKTIIDVAADRLGDVIGSGVILGLLWLLPELSSRVVVAAAILAAGFALFLVSRLHAGYVGQLATNLRKGAVRLKASEVVDATTQHILAESSLYSERQMLMKRIQHLRASRDSAASGPDHSITGAVSRGDIHEGAPASESDWGDEDETLWEATPPPSDRDDEASRLAEAVAALASSDAQAAHRALSQASLDVRLAPFLIPMLGDDAVAEDARMELRWLVPRILGQLTDALLDPDQPLLVRQRLPGVLEVCHNARSVEGLLLGMLDTEFNVRYSSTRALARMRARNKELSIPGETVFAAVRREVDVEPEEWSERDLTLDTMLPDAPLGDTPHPEVNRSLEHVFTLLELTLDRDAVHLSLQALFSSDRTLRGTAIEYLENVLPDDIRDALWRHLGLARPARRSKRSHVEIVTDLKVSAAARPPHVQ